LLESLLPTRCRSFAACRSEKPLRGFHRGRGPRPTQAFAIQLSYFVRHFVSYFSPIPFEESRTTRVFHFSPSSYQLLGVAFGACPACAACCRYCLSFPIRTSRFLSCRVLLQVLHRVVRLLRFSGLFRLVRPAPRLPGKPSPVRPDSRGALPFALPT
jgi:hypothetical protein